MQDVDKAPAIAMGPYLLRSGKLSLEDDQYLRLPGESREQIRLLYMNAPAIQVWEEMGRAPKIIGAQVRPPHTALLTLGVPFSDSKVNAKLF